MGVNIESCAFKMGTRLPAEPADDGHAGIVTIEVDPPLTPQIVVEMDFIPAFDEMLQALSGRHHPDRVRMLR
jgi:hypothetical protein